jgi:hypothetical protein
MARKGKSINDIGWQLERIRSARPRDITDAYDRRIARRVEEAENIGRRYFNNIENKKGTKNGAPDFSVDEP